MLIWLLYKIFPTDAEIATLSEYAEADKKETDDIEY